MVEVVKPSTNLSGLEEISKYARRSKATVLDWIKNENFPAAKLGRVWESDRLMIDEWKRERIEMSIKNTGDGSTNGVPR